MQLASGGDVFRLCGLCTYTIAQAQNDSICMCIYTYIYIYTYILEYCSIYSIIVHITVCAYLIIYICSYIYISPTARGRRSGSNLEKEHQKRPWQMTACHRSICRRQGGFQSPVNTATTMTTAEIPTEIATVEQ